MAVLTKDAILQADDLPRVLVEVPEWGEGAVVNVRTLSALEAESLKGIDEKGNFLGRFAVLVMCDENGERLFSDEYADKVGGKNNNALRKVCDAAQELNGMGAEAQEEAAKN